MAGERRTGGTRWRPSARAKAVALALAVVAVTPTAAKGASGDFFQPATSPEPAGFATSVVAANLGGDANVDLASGDAGAPGGVRVLIGDGTGNFTEPLTSPEAVAANAIAVANLGGDANLDVAAASITSGAVTILIGDGTGNFTPAASGPEAAGAGAISVAAANLNGDSNADLAVANFLSAGTVTILLGDGSGNFAPAATSPEAVGNAPQSVIAANLNGDANTDLAVANTNSDNVTILLGDGAGNFSPAPTTSPETVTPGDGPVSLAAANLGGSASTDLAVANASTDNVSILLGDGTGNFTQAAGTSPEPAGDAPRSIVSAELGGDGNADLAVANRLSNDVSVLLGNGTGNFTAAPSSPEPTASTGNEGIAAANLGGTASTDLAVANGSSGLAILLNDFAPPPVIPPVTIAAPTPAAAPVLTTKKCKKGQKLKKGKCVKKRRKKK